MRGESARHVNRVRCDTALRPAVLKRKGASTRENVVESLDDAA